MDIRKISVGSDYKSAMHYIVGQSVLNGSYTIHLIQEADNEFKIWIEKDNEVMMWKSFSYTMPVSVEYNINF
tara:strand:- start:5164 stop:5379 length:216 start_codon:yes stop_codon:yes gene_type:complete